MRTLTQPLPSRPLHLAWAAFQRRQVSMADLADFDCWFMPMKYKGPNHLVRAWHYLGLAWRTLRVLRRARPPVLWLQLPQVPLLWVALVYRALFDPRVVLVADCHNAMFTPPWSRVPWGLSWLARCDLVLVHNNMVLLEALRRGVSHARLRVLEDVPPLRNQALDAADPVPAIFAGQPHPWVLCVGSLGRDEPVAQVLQAAGRLQAGFIAMTGRLSNAQRNGHAIGQVPANVRMTGYLPLPEFEALLRHCDIVLALTLHDGVQLSACNEALGFGRPMVYANTSLLRGLFESAGVAVDARDPDAIAAGLKEVAADLQRWREASRLAARQRRRHWQHGPLLACQAVIDRARRRGVQVLP